MGWERDMKVESGWFENGRPMGGIKSRGEKRGMQRQRQKREGVCFSGKRKTRRMRGYVDNDD